MFDASFYKFLGICAVLFIFGFVYAFLIAKKPFPPRWTWASVAIGDFVTDCGMGAIIFLITDNQPLALVPFLCHALTGGPMILGQLTKHTLQNGGVVTIEEDELGD